MEILVDYITKLTKYRKYGKNGDFKNSTKYNRNYM